MATFSDTHPASDLAFRGGSGHPLGPAAHSAQGAEAQPDDLPSAGSGSGQLDRGVAVIVEELEGGRHRTRAELARALAERGLVSLGIGLAYVVMNAELEGVICSGPVRGAQQTYALLDERVPHSVKVGGDIAELARRFFLGHGPASIQDLARWSSLTIGQCRDAVEAVKDRLDCVTVEGVELWFGRESPGPNPSSGALLMPLYDEVTLSYPAINFPQANGHPHPQGADLFVGCVILAETNWVSGGVPCRAAR